MVLRKVAMSVRSHFRNKEACFEPLLVSINWVAADSSRSRKATREPCAAKCSTIDAPIPVAPPVIKTTLSCKLGYCAYLPVFDLRMSPLPLTICREDSVSYPTPPHLGATGTA